VRQQPQADRLGFHNYHDQNNVFPTAINYTGDSRNPAGGAVKGWGWRITLLPFIEQQPLWNALNQNLCVFNPENTTVYDVALTTYQCPSDGKVSRTLQLPAGQNSPRYDGPVNMHFSSYAGNAGTWFQQVALGDTTMQTRAGNSNGVVFQLSKVGVNSITDGTSNTLLIGEWAYGKLDDFDQQQWHWWPGYNAGDATFTTLYPMNPERRCSNSGNAFNSTWTGAAGSFHPGGANFAFADGSVKFLRDTTSVMPYDPNSCVGMGIAYDGVLYSVPPPAQFGVYQALSTRNGGEVISADSF